MMTFLGAASLSLAIVMTDRRAIALVALVGFLVSCWRQGTKSRASLYEALLRTLRDIAAGPSVGPSQGKPARPDGALGRRVRPEGYDVWHATRPE
jgi:hypothetical protein